MIAPADVWTDMTDAERAVYERAAADADDAEQWAEACADEPLDWPTLYRVIREMGGINGLGQIAPCDIPGGLGTPRDARGRLLRARAAVAYDELPLALAAAGFGDWFADMSGDELLGHLWRAWDAWDAAQHSARRSDIVPDVTAPVPAEWTRDGGSINPGKDGGSESGPRQWPGHTSGRPEVESALPAGDVAPLPEPDAADVEAYELAEVFGGIGHAPRGGDPDIIRRGLDAMQRPVIVRPRPARRARRIPDAEQRERDEILALERAAEELERQRTERATQRARLRVVPPMAAAAAPPAPPSRRAHAVMVGAILATFATSAALLVALVMSVTGASVPGLVWPLALSLPAIGAGVLPVALRPWALPVVRIRVNVSVERSARRRAA